VSVFAVSLVKEEEAADTENDEVEGQEGKPQLKKVG